MLLHPEIPGPVLARDYFLCLDCDEFAEWDDPEVRCQECQRVMTRGEPGSCPVCGDPECVRRVDERGGQR
jgi:hypothetical protein